MINGDTILIAHLGYPTKSFRAPMIYNPYFEKIGFNAIVMPMGVKAEDYAEDAVFISPTGVLRGLDGIRAAFTQLLADLPSASWDLKTQIYEGDVLFLEWAADAGSTRSDDGIDTFVFRDGLIQTQTVRYTLQQVR